MVGDFGYIGNGLTIAKSIFKKMDEVIDDTSSAENQIDFIMTTGDNVYPLVGSAPEDSEVTAVLDLFRNTNNIKNLDIYPVRGNHDCLFA